MMQCSDSHNWLVVTSLVTYCRLFLVDNAQLVSIGPVFKNDAAFC